MKQNMLMCLMHVPNYNGKVLALIHISAAKQCVSYFVNDDDGWLIIAASIATESQQCFVTVDRICRPRQPILAVGHILKRKKLRGRGHHVKKNQLQLQKFYIIIKYKYNVTVVHNSFNTSARLYFKIIFKHDIFLYIFWRKFLRIVLNMRQSHD